MMKDQSVTIAKGIAIILMVIGHSHCPKMLTHCIYMFHMPLFFFMSGYCFKTTYLNESKRFLLQRFKGTWLVYIKYGVPFLLLHNVFYSFYFYEEPYILKDFIIRFIQVVFTMNHCEQLLGGYWFLHSLFWGALIFYAILKLQCVFGGRFQCRFRGLLGGAFLLIITMVMLVFPLQVPVVGFREIMAAFFIWTGMWYKQSGLEYETKKWFLVVSSLLVILGSFLWRASMDNCPWPLAAPYMITAVLGTLVVLGMSKYILDKKIIGGDFLMLIGEHTLDILTWHFFAFKIVSILLIYMYDLSFINLASFPVINSMSDVGYWILYAIIGIVFPLIIATLSNKYRNSIIKL